MKITRLECTPYNFPKKDQSGAHELIGGPRYMLLKIHTDEGIIGIGDAGGTAPAYAGDTVDSILGFIKTVGPGILLGADPMNIELLVARMSATSKFSFQALGAVDCALHDIAGKKLGAPIYQLLGGLADDKIGLGMVVNTQSPQIAAQKSAEALKAGYKSIKLKVGRLSGTTIEQDMANLKEIRDAIGWEARLGIDANCGWDYYQALEALKKMEKFNLFMCEQPVPWYDIDGLARLRQKTGIPICADESATTLSSLFEIIEKDAADVLFIKLAKVGGIKQAQKWAAIAKGAGLSVMCGCMVGSGFEAAWQLHFLVSNEWCTHLEHENLGPILNHNALDNVKTPVTNDISRTVPRVQNGFMYPPTGPGLGLELNEELLAKYSTKEYGTIVFK